MPKNISKDKIFGFSIDNDTKNYLKRVIASGSSINTNNLYAINRLIIGLKETGLWWKIRACSLLAGPDSLSGGLVPLRSDMPTPTAFNFIEADYSRTLGLKGDGISKYLALGFSGTAINQNDSHISSWLSEVHVGGTVGVYIGNADTVTTSGAVLLGRSGINPANIAAQLNAVGINSYAAGLATGFLGVRRADSATQIVRAGGAEVSFVNASSAPLSRELLAFRMSGSAFYSTGRQAWISAGSDLSLSDLDTLLTQYIDTLK